MGAEIQRKRQLTDATIRAIGEAGSLDVTVGQIARLAGVSPALAFHYFGDKDHLLLSAMRHVLTIYGIEVRQGLSQATTPDARLRAIVAACFSTGNFERGVIAAWMNFYVLAQSSDQAHRLLRLYHRRLHSNLVHGLRPLAGAEAPAIARRLAAQIDGLYLRAVLSPGAGAPGIAKAQVEAALSRELALAGTRR